jgi:hypothetical protein
MGLLNLTESERLEILNLHNNARIIKEQVAPTVPAAAGTPAAAPQTVADVIKELQTVLNTKYGTKLVVDGKWGNLTQTAFETALKSKSAAPAGTSGTGTPAGTSGTGTPAAAAPTAAAPTAAAPTAAAPTAAAPTAAAPTAAAPTAAAPTAAAPTAAPDVVGAEAPQQLSQASQQALGGQLTPKQIRQQSRFDQRLARQARRTEKRAQQ